ncbi:MAG: TonB-dependent receptor [Gammaproteobacteria bacterium]|nr:TonB-dependent receptor [Gammaproteobacteria bacterium]
MKILRERNSLTTAIGLVLSIQAYSQESIDEIVVIGSRASLQSAIQKQRDSDKVAGVIDSDALGNFADINVAESLRRISGIMVENDQGEGRYVTVRGMNTDLNAMTINGVSTASPEDRRGIILDGVPSDLLDSMTVYKTLTPNLDADTIGGAIDLETITAFSFDGLFVRLKAETNYNELINDANNPKLAATFSNRWELGDGEFGAALVLSDQSRRIIAHNNENGGWGDTAPNDDFETRYYDLTREREGVVLALDYRANSGNSYFAHIFHNEYADSEWRAKWEVRDSIEEEQPVINGSTFSYPNARVDTESRNRTEIREISSIRLGANLQFGERHRGDFEIFASQAEQDDRDRQAAIFRSAAVDDSIVYDNTDPRRPAVIFPDTFYEPSSFPMRIFEREFTLNTDEDAGAKVDFFTDLSINTQLQYGAKIRQREKINDYVYCGYEPVDELLLSSVEYVTPQQFLNTVEGPTASYDQVKQFVSGLGSGSVALSDGSFCQAPGIAYELSGDEDEESIPADWVTEEDIKAAYIMGTTVTGNATWVYGLRYEDTLTTYRGKAFDDGFAGLTAFENNYDFLAPSLNVKFDLSEEQVMRFGVFRSLVRPGFGESRAGAVVNTEDNEIEGGNPELNPTTAWNLDLSYEYYMGEATFFGAGLFYKQIEDAIVEVEANDVVFRDQLWDQAATYINTDNASIAGFEMSFQTAWNNGLLLVANYTHSDGETDLPAISVYGQRSVPFFKQAKHTANLSIGYNLGQWDVRLATNYRSDFLDEIGDQARNDRFTDDFLQIDLTARYKLNDNIMLTAEAINLNDQPEYYYFGTRSRLSQYDEYGTTYGMGVRMTF